jgi:hypothetical protein
MLPDAQADWFACILTTLDYSRVVLRPLPADTWPVDFDEVEGRWGPSTEADCPCGSRRRVRSCHGTKVGEWRSPVSAPLIQGPRTGYSHSRCYAGVSADCSTKISLEHWLSHDVQQSYSIDGKLYVSGMPHNGGKEKQVSTKTFGYRVLCTRHNAALSRLDTVAGNLFRVLYGYQTAQADPTSAASEGASQIALFDGPDVERWLLKTLLGGVAARAYGNNGIALTGVRSDVDHSALVDVLFRGGSWPTGWGFYFAGTPGEELRELAPIALRTASGPDGTAWQLDLSIGVVELRLYLGKPDRLGSSLIAKPGGVVLDKRDAEGQRMVGFAWPDPGHSYASLSRIGD